MAVRVAEESIVSGTRVLAVRICDLVLCPERRRARFAQIVDAEKNLILNSPEQICRSRDTIGVGVACAVKNRVWLTRSERTLNVRAIAFRRITLTRSTTGQYWRRQIARRAKVQRECCLCAVGLPKCARGTVGACRLCMCERDDHCNCQQQQRRVHCAKIKCATSCIVILAFISLRVVTLAERYINYIRQTGYR